MTQDDDNEDFRLKWKFRTSGCFRKNPEMTVNQNYFLVGIKNVAVADADVITTKIKVDKNLEVSMLQTIFFVTANS